MANARKKVIVRTLDQQVHPGYLPASGLLDDLGEVALLNLEARITPIPLATVRWIAFVRDFNLAESADPEHLSRRTFLARPRAEGLWVRLTSASGEVLEGLAPIDISFADALLEDRGVYLTPPDIRSNTQRLFVPRTAFAALQVVAVVTSPSRKEPLPMKVPSPQTRLFP